MSWVPSMKNSKIGYFVSDVTKPVLDFFSARIPRIGMLDFSPIVVLFLLDFLSSLILKLL